MDLEGAITPAQVDLLASAQAKAAGSGASLVFARVDTPGGLAESMREMVKLLLNSPVPVMTWVGPAGAHAASAGVFLVAASHVASMSPQATIGAASPVGVGGGDVPETMAEKVKNDLMSLLRGAAQARGRNVEWYAESVDRAVSITGLEAAMTRVVDFVAVSPEDAMAQAGRRGVPGPGGGVLHFEPGQVVRIDFEPGFRHELLSWLMDPQIAYFLLLAGMVGLFFELATPGVVLPGVVGGICLLLSLYALSVLPTNAAGLLLILFSGVLFVAEAFITSYALLSIAGLASLFLGSVILFKPDQGVELPLTSILATVVGVGLIVGLVLYLTARVQLKRPMTGVEAMLGMPGVVREWRDDQGLVFIRGELWTARSVSGVPLSPGMRVVVVSIEGLVLTVRIEATS